VLEAASSGSSTYCSPRPGSLSDEQLGADENCAANGNAMPAAAVAAGRCALGAKQPSCLGSLLPQLFPPSPAVTCAPAAAAAEVDAAGAAAEAAPAPSAARVPALDAEAECILSLFPEQVQAAVRDACTAAAADGSSSGSRGSYSSSSTQGQQQAQPKRRLVELVVDAGRPVVARFADGGEVDLPCHLEVEVSGWFCRCSCGCCLCLPGALCSAAMHRLLACSVARSVATPHSDLSRLSACCPQPNTPQEALALLRAAKPRLRLGQEWGEELFYGDNRSGIPGTLHRISAMRGRDRRELGLTYRIGRHVSGELARQL